MSVNMYASNSGFILESHILKQEWEKNKNSSRIYTNYCNKLINEHDNWLAALDRETSIKSEIHTAEKNKTKIMQQIEIEAESCKPPALVFMDQLFTGVNKENVKIMIWSLEEKVDNVGLTILNTVNENVSNIKTKENAAGFLLTLLNIKHALFNYDGNNYLCLRDASFGYDFDHLINHVCSQLQDLPNDYSSWFWNLLNHIVGNINSDNSGLYKKIAISVINNLP